jgi:hypothetical protein
MSQELLELSTFFCCDCSLAAVGEFWWEVCSHQCCYTTQRCCALRSGLSAGLARQVALELTAKDVIRAHARDELGIDLDDMANPLQAAIVSGFAFTLGALLPLAAGAFISDAWYVCLTAVQQERVVYLSFTAHTAHTARKDEPLSSAYPHTIDEVGLHFSQYQRERSLQVTTPEMDCSFATPCEKSFRSPNPRTRLVVVTVAATIGLALFGFVGAALGGARVFVGGLRVLVGGLLAMAITFGVGKCFGVSVE